MSVPLGMYSANENAYLTKRTNSNDIGDLWPNITLIYNSIFNFLINISFVQNFSVYYYHASAWEISSLL